MSALKHTARTPLKRKSPQLAAILGFFIFGVFYVGVLDGLLAFVLMGMWGNLIGPDAGGLAPLPLLACAYYSWSKAKRINRRIDEAERVAREAAEQERLRQLEQEARIRAEAEQRVRESARRTCEYCGRLMQASETKCSGCGASL